MPRDYHDGKSSAEYLSEISTNTNSGGGLATESTLSTLNGKIPSKGQKTMTGSVPVVLASNQSSINVADASVLTALGTIDTTLQGQDDLLDDVIAELVSVKNNTAPINDAEVHLSAIDTNIVSIGTNIASMKIFNQDAELHLSALDTNIANRLPTTIGPKDESLSLTIARNNTTGAFDTHARTNITDRATSKALLCNSDGELNVKNSTNRSYGSEVSYVSGQSISGSGDHTGSAITLDANVKALYVEHNFSHTGIKYEILGSIDNSTFLSTGLEFNAGGLAPATLTGLSTILGTSGGAEGFPPYIKFKFSNSDSSAQTATLSYVIQSH